jgi:4-amino-4-deoxy-L-arabinose transferase-like glycosyltransferase
MEVRRPSREYRLSGQLEVAAPRVWVILFILSLLAVVVEPGRIPLFEPDEGRYSEIPREMLATGDWVTPRLDGVLYFEKPPLQYWAVALSFKIFGQSEFTARIPSKLSIVGMALAAFLFARRRYGPRVGLLSGLIVSTSLLAFAMARITIIDPLLSLALSWAAFAFAAFAESEPSGDKRRTQMALYGLHIACAAAVMSKGLIGIVLPGGAILVWVVVTARYRILPKLFSPGPLVVFLLLTVPWHVLIAMREKDFLSFYFVHEHFDRFFKSEHRREGNSLYFVAVLLGGLLPWTAFLGHLKESLPGRTLRAWREQATESFLWIFFLLIFAFFSVSRSKLIPYILPVWPAVAVLLSLGIERSRRAGSRFAVGRWVLGMLFGMLTAGALVYGFAVGYVEKFGILEPAILMLAALTAGSLWNFTASMRSRLRGEIVAAAALPWLVFLAGALWCFPRVAQKITPWSLISVLEDELKPGDLLLQKGHYLQAVPFYMKRLTPVVDLDWHELNFGQARAKDRSLVPTKDEFARLWNGEKRVLVIVHKAHVKDFGKPPLSVTPFTLLARANNGKHFLFANRPAGSPPKPPVEFSP